MDGMPLYVIQPAGPTMSALHTDNIGTVQKATSALKTVNWTCNYRPFGACTPTTTITMNLRVPGAYADTTGLLHVGARDESTVFGRWLERDPIGLAGAFPGYPLSTVNGYPYALNDPINNTDPTGNIAVLDNILGGLFAAGVDVAAQIYQARQSGQPFHLNKSRTGEAFILGAATDGLSAVFVTKVGGLGLDAASSFALKTAGNATIAAGAGVAQTAYNNWRTCSDDSLLSAAIWSAGFGALGSASHDAITGFGPALSQARFNSYSAGQKNLLLGVADFNGMDLVSPGKGTVIGGSIANSFISGAPSFVGGSNAGGASCTCSH
jgi:RHS repeat-associated protein